MQNDNIHYSHYQTSSEKHKTKVGTLQLQVFRMQTTTTTVTVSPTIRMPEIKRVAIPKRIWENQYIF